MFPAVRVKGALRGPRVVLQSFLEQAGDRALGASNRTVKEKDAALRTIVMGGRLEHVDQPHERPLKTVDRIPPFVSLVVKEFVVDDLFFVLLILLDAVGNDHVVDALKGRSSYLGIAPYDFQVFLKAAFPMEPLKVIVLSGRHIPASGKES